MSQRVIKENQASLGHKVIQERWDLEGRRVLMERQELKETGVSQARESLALLDPLDHKARPEQMDQKVNLNTRP